MSKYFYELFQMPEYTITMAHYLFDAALTLHSGITPTKILNTAQHVRMRTRNVVETDVSHTPEVLLNVRMSSLSSYRTTVETNCSLNAGYIHTTLQYNTI